MRKALRICSIGVLLMAAAPQLEAQTYTCLPASDSLAIVLKDYIVEVVTGSDATDRGYASLPATTASKVSIVSSSTTCNQAGAAFHAASTPPGTPPISRTLLVVVKVGTTRYVVRDYSEDTAPPTVVFDKNWVKLTAWGP
jgi:hypothetical protein